MPQLSNILDDKVVCFAKQEPKIGPYGHFNKNLHALIKAKDYAITKTADFLTSQEDI
jgi:hypothetical protein